MPRGIDSLVSSFCGARGPCIVSPAISFGPRRVHGPGWRWRLTSSSPLQKQNVIAPAVMRRVCPSKSRRPAPPQSHGNGALMVCSPEVGASVVPSTVQRLEALAFQRPQRGRAVADHHHSRSIATIDARRHGHPRCGQTSAPKVTLTLTLISLISLSASASASA